jgi:hypothetical protein
MNLAQEILREEQFEVLDNLSTVGHVELDLNATTPADTVNTTSTRTDTLNTTSTRTDTLNTPADILNTTSTRTDILNTTNDSNSYQVDVDYDQIDVKKWLSTQDIHKNSMGRIVRRKSSIRLTTFEESHTVYSEALVNDNMQNVVNELSKLSFDSQLPPKAPTKKRSIQSIKNLRRVASESKLGVNWIWNLLKKPKASSQWSFFRKKPFQYPPPIQMPSRLDLEREKQIYRLSHVKLADSTRPLHQQVGISNFMLYILSVHSDVTIKGRGPKGRRGRRRKAIRQPEPSSSSSEEEEEEDDDDEDIPLGMLNPHDTFAVALHTK